MHKVIDPTHKPLPNGKPPFPVLILHGLFQSSGSFVTSEERSLAFWLARQGGYSVYLGNTRGVFDMGHRNLSRGDPRFWGECSYDLVGMECMGSALEWRGWGWQWGGLREVSVRARQKGGMSCGEWKVGGVDGTVR